MPHFNINGTFDPLAVAVLENSFIDMGMLTEVPNDKKLFATKLVPVTG